jgi:hypothetical protein
MSLLLDEKSGFQIYKKNWLNNIGVKNVISQLVDLLKCKHLLAGQASPPPCLHSPLKVKKAG